MARRAFGCTLGGSSGPGQFASVGFPAVAIVPTATEAAVAVLEADGASPTQAHVTSLRNAWNPCSASMTASNVTLQWDDSVVTTRTALRNAVAAILKAIDGSDVAP